MTENTANKPIHVGIIMDGNRRWARERGLPTIKGHQAGYDKLKEMIPWMNEHQVETLYVFGFSTENWNRSEEEVSYLMNLIRKMRNEVVDIAMKENVRIQFLGQTERFAQDIQEVFSTTEEKTKDNTGGTLAVCLSYGGRAEILHAIKHLPKEAIDSLTEETFSNYLWSAGLPDPDIIIRTSGEKRLSGFLTWRGVYSELFFVDEHWPAFSKESFDAIIKEYKNRKRRFGK